MVREKTVEKAMKAIVWYYEKKPEGAIRAEFLGMHGVCKEESTQALIDHLCSRGLITYAVTHKGFPEEIHLTDSGRCFLTNRALEKGRDRKMYIIGWIQFAISTLIAIAALIVSLSD